MADLFASGRLVDIVLILIVLEVVAIALYKRNTGRGIALADLLPNILAGAFLLVALRVSLAGGGWAAVSGCLACAGIAHVVDVGRRWQRRP
jgi:hypothetical protein